MEESKKPHCAYNIQLGPLCAGVFIHWNMAGKGGSYHTVYTRHKKLSFGVFKIAIRPRGVIATQDSEILEISEKISSCKLFTSTI
jgi:hypothetical protein